MVRVLRSGPWTFDNQVLMLLILNKSMTVQNVKFDVVSLWVQIRGAPFDRVSPKSSSKGG